jgi:hypothetical protein
MRYLLFWLGVVIVIGLVGFKTLFVCALKCERCGEIVDKDEYRVHDFKCKSKG